VRRPWLLWLAAGSAVVAAATAPMWASLWLQLLEGEPAPHVPIYVAASLLAGLVAVATWVWPAQWLAAAAVAATHLTIAAFAAFAATSWEAFVPFLGEHLLAGVFAAAWAVESFREGAAVATTGRGLDPT